MTAAVEIGSWPGKNLKHWLVLRDLAERERAEAAVASAAAIASGSWLPLDLEGSEVRQRPAPCQLERIKRRLEAGQRSMCITDATTGAVVFETTTNGKP